MTKSTSKSFIMPELPQTLGGTGSGAFTDDLWIVMEGVERYNLAVPDSITASADSLIIAQAVLDGIESETPEHSDDPAQAIRNQVGFDAVHFGECALARRARLEAATILAHQCAEALPIFEPQFADVFNAKVAEIRPLLAALEGFRTERPNFVMEGYRAAKYNQDAILADSDASDAFRRASRMSVELFTLSNVRNALAYLLPQPTELAHYEPELVIVSRLVRIEKGFDGRDLAAAMRAKGLEHWAAIMATAGVSSAWQTVAEQEALQLRIAFQPRGYSGGG
jgi:hypothetical protein